MRDGSRFYFSGTRTNLWIQSRALARRDVAPRAIHHALAQRIALGEPTEQTGHTHRKKMANFEKNPA